MGNRVRRAEATARRRRAILDAALECFDQVGFQKTTMEDIRARAGASMGSIYHHFTSKEQLAGALYLEGIREVQAKGLAALVRHRSAERGVRAVVRWYLDWIQENPKMASFLFENRHAEFVMPQDRRLDEMNERLRKDFQTWLRGHIDAGDLPRVGMEMYWAVLLGPADFVARRRLREGNPGALSESAKALEDAAWGGLRALVRRR